LQKTNLIPSSSEEITCNYPRLKQELAAQNVRHEGPPDMLTSTNQLNAHELYVCDETSRQNGRRIMLIRQESKHILADYFFTTDLPVVSSY
jgi:hypothetical protein